MKEINSMIYCNSFNVFYMLVVHLMMLISGGVKRPVCLQSCMYINGLEMYKNDHVLILHLPSVPSGTCKVVGSIVYGGQK